MATSRAFAHNPSGEVPNGATGVGNIAVQSTNWTQGLGGLTWYNGPDEELGYVICYTSTGTRTFGSQSGVISGTAFGFRRTSSLNDAEFISMANVMTGQNFASAAAAKTWLNSNGYWTSWTQAAVSYLLDTYNTEISAAYSLRKLSATYNGSAIRVRRSSDNTEQDIGFDVNGELDQSALTSFVGAGDGFIVKWYDQAGSLRDASQTSASNQPKIVSSGVVQTDGSKPSVVTDANSWMNITWNLPTFTTAATVARVVTQTTVNYLLGGTEKGIFYNGAYGTVHGLGGYDGTNVSQITGEDLNRHLGWFNMKSSRIYISKDGDSTIDTGAFASSMTINALGARSDVLLTFSGKIQEIVLWSTEQSTNESGIKSNINSYYSIY